MNGVAVIDVFDRILWIRIGIMPGYYLIDGLFVKWYVKRLLSFSHFVVKALPRVFIKL